MRNTASFKIKTVPIIASLLFGMILLQGLWGAVQYIDIDGDGILDEVYTYPEGNFMSVELYDNDDPEEPEWEITADVGPVIPLRRYIFQWHRYSGWEDFSPIITAGIIYNSVSECDGEPGYLPSWATGPEVVRYALLGECNLSISGDSSICPVFSNNTTTFTVSGGTGPYAWSSASTSIATVSSGSGSSITVTANNPGVTNIIVTDAIGCSTNKSISVTFDDIINSSHYVSCQSLFQHPFNSPTYNGCGTDNFQIPVSYIPPPGYPNEPVTHFIPSCNIHDIDYATCNTAKATADSNFRTNMLNQCNGNYPNQQILLNGCTITATLAYDAVYLFGNGPFIDAQVNHCACCDGI